MFKVTVVDRVIPTPKTYRINELDSQAPFLGSRDGNAEGIYVVLPGHVVLFFGMPTSSTKIYPSVITNVENSKWEVVKYFRNCEISFK